MVKKMNMATDLKTIYWECFIKMEYDKWNKIMLLQDDGLVIDLMGRFIEATKSFGTYGQVQYWVCKNKISRNEALERYLQKLYSGKINVEFEEDYVYYSTLTGGDTTHDCEFTIGGHNLYSELQDKEGMYLIIELTFKPHVVA